MGMTRDLAPQLQQNMSQFGRYLEEEKNASNSTVMSYQRDLKKLFQYLCEKGVENVQDITAKIGRAHV